MRLLGFALTRIFDLLWFWVCVALNGGCLVVLICVLACWLAGRLLTDNGDAGCGYFDCGVGG